MEFTLCYLVRGKLSIFLQKISVLKDDKENIDKIGLLNLNSIFKWTYILSLQIDKVGFYY